MCGIAGLFNAQAVLPEAPGALSVLAQMTGAMVHRGPDAEGHWADPRGRCFLGHRRLSIIDTSDAGRQPMSGIDGRWVISFNGEIYNFQEIRPLLEREGIAFRGRTDTEVLIESIALWGLDALPKLDGMFAFAAFNQESGELILARDPFGEKPLYYMELSGGGLAFASELQALQCVPGFDSEISPDAMAEVLMFQYIGAPRTIYRSVKKLLPGHWLAARAGEPLRMGRYFQFSPTGSGFGGRSVTDLTDELEDILVRSLRRRLISDVPLGAFLSGGVDSSLVCALVRRNLGVPLKTFSIGFEGAPESEHEIARKFAAHLGTAHHEQILAPDTAEFLLGIGRLLDEPNADSSCMPTYLLSRFARSRVTVAVSGDGGDEMFGGYGRYFSTLDENRDHRRGKRPGWRPGQAYYSNRILVSTEEHIEELFGGVPEGLRDHLSSLREELNQPIPPLACLLRGTDVENYMPGAVLPKVDRMSMQHSLEVRTPFLNTELARFAEQLPEELLYANKRGKVLLRELAYRHLPRDLIDLPKQGFGIPMSRWGRDALLRVANQLLESPESVLRGALGDDAIGRFMRRQRRPDGFSTYQVWALAMLESWLRTHPAKIPDLGKAIEPRLHAVSHDESATELCAVPFGDTAWAIVPRAIAMRGGKSSALGADEQAATLKEHLLRLAEEILPDLSVSPGAAGASKEARGLGTSDWSELSAVTTVLGSDAVGATLVVLDRAAGKAFDFSNLHHLRRAGVASVVYPHPYRVPGHYVRIRIRPPGSWRHERAARRRLQVHALAVWRVLGARRGNGLRRDAGPFARIEGPPDVELNHRYCVFEGGTQLPPLPCSHEDIELKGRGRYSIWSKTCVFAPTVPSALLRRYWVVEQTEATRPDLQFWAEHIDNTERDLDAFFAKLEELIRGETVQPISLAPGDHIVVVTSALPPGGAERQWCYLAAGLRQAGYRVTFVVLEKLTDLNAHYLPFLKESGIPVIEVEQLEASAVLRWNPASPLARYIAFADGNPFGARLPQLSALLAELQPKAVFAQLDMPNLMTGVAAHLAGVPRTVLSFRNYNPWTFSYLRVKWFLRCYQALARSHRIALSGNSHAANADYAGWIGVAPESVGFVPNAIVPEDFRAPIASDVDALRKVLDLDAASRVIVGVFRLSEEKNPLGFVDVCDRVKRAIPGLRVFVAGIGPMQREVEERISALGLQSAVSLLGRRNDVPELLSVATLLLLASNFEGMPNVLMEAQLMGVPVVATRTGGTPDVVIDGKTGYLADAGDIDGLARFCIALLRDGVTATAMGHAGRERMKSFFSRDQMIERYLALAAEPRRQSQASVATCAPT